MFRVAMVFLLVAPLSLEAQKLQPCPKETPALRLEASLRASGLQVGGVEEFPAGLYQPIGKNEDGTFYVFEKPLVARLMADTVKVSGGLFVPIDPDEDTRGWYSLPDGARNPVIAPEQGVDSSWEGDPTLPASDPYKAANLSAFRKKVGLSEKPRLIPVPRPGP